MAKGHRRHRLSAYGGELSLSSFFSLGASSNLKCLLMLELLIVLLSPLLFLPGLTGYMARGNGRSFWRWFAIGLCLPYVSLIIITIVVYRDQRRAQRTPPKTL